MICYDLNHRNRSVFISDVMVIEHGMKKEKKIIVLILNLLYEAAVTPGSYDGCSFFMSVHAIM